MFMLHGYGSNEQDLFSFAGDLSERYEVFSLRAPLELPPFGYAWYQIDFEAPQGKWSNLEQAKESLDRLEDFVGEASKAFDFEIEELTLIGFSQGCILSLAMALRNPLYFSRVVGLSGYLNQQLLPESINREAVNNLKIYCSHGTEDPVIPVEWARITPTYFESLGLSITYEEYPSGHGVSAQNYQSFLDWILGY